MGSIRRLRAVAKGKLPFQQRSASRLLRHAMGRETVQRWTNLGTLAGWLVWLNGELR